MCHELLGQFLKKIGRLRDAERSYRQATPLWEKLVAQDPKSADFRLHLSWNYDFLSELLVELGDHAEAAEIAVKLPTAFLPRDWEGYQRVAFLLASCVLLAESDANLLEADRKIVAQAYLHRSKESMQQAIERIVGDTGAHNSVAWRLATDPKPGLRDPDQAVALAKKAVEIAPAQGIYWNTLGTAHYRAGNWQAAIQTLRQASELGQGSSFSFDAFFLAMAHWQLGDKERAGNWYAPALVWMERRAPKNEELIRFRSEAASLLGLPEELTPELELAKGDDVKLYTLVLEADSQAAWAHGARGSTCAERGQWTDAVTDFAKAAELNPDYLFHQYRQALVCLKLGDLAGYRRLCAEMLARPDPAAKADSAQWSVWTCALTADAVADWKVPLQRAREAVADNPQNFHALYHHGAVLYRAGQYHEALQRLTEAEAAYRPDDQKRTPAAYNWLFLAMTCHRLGQVEETKKWHDMAVEWIEQETQKRTEVSSATNALPWNRRLTMQLLRREAENS